jgi:hypothetical protein
LLRDAVTVVALPFISLTSTSLVVVEGEFLEAAVFVTFVRLISALGFTSTFISLFDAFTVGAGPLGLWVTSTDFVVVEWILSEAALFHQLIRVVRALGFTITHFCLEGTFTIFASHLSLWVAATDFGVIIVESSEAALLVSFISLVRALVLTVTDLSLEGTFTIITSSFSLWVAATGLISISTVFLETTLVIAFIRLISAL